jgi:HK97 family phage portal protein
MARSLIGKVVNVAAATRYNRDRPIPFNSQWNVNGNTLYGSGPQDRFTQLQTSRSQGTLYAIIQLLSTGQAKAKWKIFDEQTDGRVRYASTDVGSDMRKEVLRHQAMKLWQRPNPFHTGFMFREQGWQFMELVGEWYWILNRGPSGKGMPVEMWSVRPDRMTPVPDVNNFLAGWVYTGPNGEEVPLINEEVIQMRYPDPSDPYRGLSAVQALMADIDSAKYTAEWSRNFFLNSATPGGIVQFAKRLSDDEFNEFVARWRQQHQGVARGHRVGVLEQGAEWIPNTMTMNDMQFAELSRISRDKIREAYRIHQALLGNSDDVNRANAQTAEEVHVAWHEVTRLERTRDILNSFYLPMFGRTADGREFDFQDPTPTSSNEANDELTTKAAAAAQLASTQLWAPEDILETVGLPPMRQVLAVGGAQTGDGPPALGSRNPVTRDYSPDVATSPDPGPEDMARTVVWAAQVISELKQRRPSVTDQEAQAFGRMMLSNMAHSNGNGHRKEVTAR